MIVATICLIISDLISIKAYCSWTVAQVLPSFFCRINQQLYVFTFQKLISTCRHLFVRWSDRSLCRFLAFHQNRRQCEREKLCLPLHRFHWILWKMNPHQTDFQRAAVKSPPNRYIVDLMSLSHMNCREFLGSDYLQHLLRWHPGKVQLINRNVPKKCAHNRLLRDDAFGESVSVTCKQAAISTIRPSLSGHHSRLSSINGIPVVALPLRSEVFDAASVLNFNNHRTKNNVQY